MVDFRPFRGIRYQTGVAGPLDDLICPPYDVISPAHEQQLLGRSEYNMVRLELRELTGAPSPDRYASSAYHYRHWLEAGVLGRDEASGYYLLRQRFPDGPGTLERYSLVGALRLEEWGGGVLPHEQTGVAAKADRLALMEASAANFSPLMGLFGDDSGLMRRLQGWVATRRPDGQAEGDDGQRYTLWRIAEPELTALVSQTLALQPVYIADGHHRYETALNYWKQRRDQGSGASPASGFVMMGLIATDDPGLRILPYHREVGRLPPELFAQIRDRIAQLFITQPVAIDTSTPGPLEGLVAQEGRAGPAIGLMGPHGEGPYLLTVGNPSLVDRYLPSDQEAALREVEAWLLQEVVLRPVLGDSFPDYVTYTHEGAQALAGLQSGQAQLAFFLKGLPPPLFERLVGAGIRLPRKSTYFHPKLPSGLVINPLEDSLQPQSPHAQVPTG